MSQSSPLRSTLLALLVTLGGAISLPAEPVVSISLKNGDHITGEIISRSDGMIYVRSSSVGYLAIHESDATITNIPEIPADALVGLPPQPPAAKPAVTTAAVKKPAAPAPDPKRWKFKVEMGFAQSSGRIDGVTESLIASAERTVDKDNYLASFRRLYGEQTDVINTDLTDASARWRHDLTPKTFTQETTSYLHDAISGVRANVEQNISLGHRVVDTPRHVVNMGAGVTGRYRSELDSEYSVIGLGEVFEEYNYKINGRFTLIQNFRGLYSPQPAFGQTTLDPTLMVDPRAENYKVTFNGALQGKVTERISMNIRFDYEYDNSLVRLNAKTDQHITSSLGYSF